MAKLGDICSFQSGGTPSKANQSFYGGSIPWVTTVSLNGSIINSENAVEWITEDAIKQSAAKIVPANSILIGTRVGIGKTAINSVEMSTSQDIISLIDIDEKKWDKQFLCLFFFSQREFLLSQARGATIKGIKIETISNLELPNYTLETQRQIAANLDKVTHTIDLCNAILEKLDMLVKSRFVEMFGEFIKTSTPVDFESICQFVSVGIANSATHAFCDNGIIMFRNQNIKEDYLDDSDIVYIKREFAEKYKNKKLEKDDLIIVRTGYPGIACLVPEKYAGSQTFTTLIARLKKNCEINPRFICHFINSKYGKKYVLDNSAGAAQQNFGATALSKMPVYLPPIELQNKYIKFVEQTDKSKSAVKQLLEKAETLKKALMQEYFG